jgi:hypothetical protein
MTANGHATHLNGKDVGIMRDERKIIEWDWDIEHDDRRREAKYDAALHDAQHPFQVDRRVLKDVVRENMDDEVGRIVFISSGKQYHLGVSRSCSRLTRAV